jgi:PPOX class probable F420-dependent enzyme
MHLSRDEALRRAAAADHGVLATLHEPRGADLVPACFAIDGDRVAIPVDSVKPKGSTALGRIRNLERDPRATLLVEHWDPDDWSRLWWVRLSLVRTAEPPERVAALERALRGRYRQYATAPFVEILTFRIDHVGGWAASSE